MTGANALSIIAPIAREFAIDGELVEARRHGHGHINATFVATYRSASADARFIHQRINTRVFSDVPALMSNIERVLDRLGARGVRAMRLVRTRGGEPASLHGGEWWRTYEFVEGASSRETLTPAQAFDAARAFGGFAQVLSDLPPPPLHATIPRFHDTRNRVRLLEQAAKNDPRGRACDAAPELQLAVENEALARALESLRGRGVRDRVVHNDAKLDNVLLDDATDAAVCVIDLDTVMPGLSLYDFGDMARTGASTAPEDARDLERVDVRLDMFEALARGFTEGAGPMLDAIEREHLVLAAQVLTFESAVRFLTDHLLGDTYFHVARPGHNMDRARSQFALLRALRRRDRELAHVVSAC